MVAYPFRRVNGAAPPQRLPMVRWRVRGGLMDSKALADFDFGNSLAISRLIFVLRRQRTIDPR